MKVLIVFRGDELFPKCTICVNDTSKVPSDTLIKIIKCNPNLIEYLTNPCERLQLKAIKLGASIMNIDNPTEKVQLIAVKKRAEDFAHIKYPTIKTQIMAIKLFPMNIINIARPIRQIQLKALEIFKKEKDASNLLHLKIFLKNIKRPCKELSKYLIENKEFFKNI